MLRFLKLFLRGIEGLIFSFFDRYNDCGAPTCVLGSSVDWRDIELYRFGIWKRKILYVWGMHGNEVGTVKLMQRWIRFLKKKRNVPKDVTVYVISCLNPDAFAIAKWKPDWFRWGRFVKHNAHGVDLNRNFPTKNRSSDAMMFLSTENISISWGSWPWSEPETRVLLELIEKEKIDTVYVYHNRRWTVMSSFTPSSDERARRYVEHSVYRLFDKKERDKWWDEKHTGHFTLWWQENDVDVIEIEMTTRWLSEWRKNKNALLDSLFF